jgi:hypothetical protein
MEVLDIELHDIRSPSHSLPEDTLFRLFQRAVNVSILRLQYSQGHPLPQEIWEGCSMKLTCLFLGIQDDSISCLGLKQLQLPHLVELELSFYTGSAFFYASALTEHFFPFLSQHRHQLQHLAIAVESHLDGCCLPHFLGTMAQCNFDRLLRLHLEGFDFHEDYWYGQEHFEDPEDAMETLRTLLAIHIKQLQELVMRGSRKHFGRDRRIPVTWMPSALPDKSSLRSLQLGITIEITEDLFGLLAILLSQLHTLIISQPQFDSHNLAKLSALAANGNGSEMRELLLNVGVPSRDVLGDLKSAFPYLRILQLRIAPKRGEVASFSGTVSFCLLELSA